MNDHVEGAYDDFLALGQDLIDANAKRNYEISGTMFRNLDRKTLERLAAFAFGTIGSLYRKVPECRDAIDDMRDDHD